MGGTGWMPGGQDGFAVVVLVRLGGLKDIQLTVAWWACAD
jgi:hypothetical protein